MVPKANAKAESPGAGRSFQWKGEFDQRNQRIENSLREQRDRMLRGFSASAQRGYAFLTKKRYLPADFDREVLEAIGNRSAARWTAYEDVEWLEPSWQQYGLSVRPEDPSLPLQYVEHDGIQFSMNCFACHGGNLYGVSYPGAPNTLYALEALTRDVRAEKLRTGKTLTHMDIGSMFMPLGKTVGTSNAVMFGVALMNYRDAELNVFPLRLPAAMTHHDMDAPAWWHFQRKNHIYADGFAEKGHRGLMQFMLVRENGPEQFAEWESDFRDVYAMISEIKPPEYPLSVNREEVLLGKQIFEQNCQHCHGSYGSDSYDYPEVCIDISEVGTDEVRLFALTPKHRSHYGQSWFGHFGEQATVEEPAGYVAPPLDGIWASAPYLHNGSVPTLWHVLRPDIRPAVWRRTHLGLNPDLVGFHVESLSKTEFAELQGDAERGVGDEGSGAQKPMDFYFDTAEPGKSASGHDFAAHLSDEECKLLLEFLKTL